MRKKLTEFENDTVENVVSNESLDTLIPKYAKDKSELDAYKKLCDSENELIKSELSKICQSEYSSNGYIAKINTSQRVSINEDKLLLVVKRHNIQDVIKTREYVDSDALENYLYHLDEESKEYKELISDIDTCRDVKEVISLRVSKEK